MNEDDKRWGKAFVRLDLLQQAAQSPYSFLKWENSPDGGIQRFPILASTGKATLVKSKLLGLDINAQVLDYKPVVTARDHVPEKFIFIDTAQASNLRQLAKDNKLTKPQQELIEQLRLDTLLYGRRR